MQVRWLEERQARLLRPLNNMYKVIRRKTKIQKRAVRVRGGMLGTADKPRLSVHRTNNYIYAQIIDDTSGKTIASALSKPSSKAEKRTKSQSSFNAGKELAETALKKGVKQVVFDRSGYKYHGRVKQVAEGAREGGLKL